MKASQHRCTSQNIREVFFFPNLKRLGAGDKEARQKPVLRPTLQTSDLEGDQRLRNKAGPAVSLRRSPIHSVSTSFSANDTEIIVARELNFQRERFPSTLWYRFTT
jgi:hypothetical protein